MYYAYEQKKNMYIMLCVHYNCYDMYGSNGTFNSKKLAAACLFSLTSDRKLQRFNKVVNLQPLYLKVILTHQQQFHIDFTGNYTVEKSISIMKIMNEKIHAVEGKIFPIDAEHYSETKIVLL